MSPLGLVAVEAFASKRPPYAPQRDIVRALLLYAYVDDTERPQAGAHLAKLTWKTLFKAVAGDWSQYMAPRQPIGEHGRLVEQASSLLEQHRVFER